MIPNRVYMKNFLCYSEQEYCFAKHPVWLLHGPNGVGKSTVFDAMIYALYGESNRSDTRKNAVVDVIRHGEPSMRVEFDFELDGKEYQIWRTRTRSGPTKQGVQERRDGNWHPIKDINSVEDADGWVTHHLGLNYATFVSTILLRQGAAEKLIDAKADVRREVFRSFINLEPYIALHQRVYEARSEITAEKRSLHSTLEHTPVVTDEQLGKAVAEETSADEQLAACTTRAQGLQDQVGHARLWEQYDADRSRWQAELDKAAERAAHADSLEAQANECRELRVVVPVLTRLAKLQMLRTQQQTKFVAENEAHEAAETRMAKLTTTRDQAQAEANAQQEAVNALAVQIATTEGQRKERADEIDRAEKAQNLHEQLADARTKTFAPDLDAQLATATREETEAKAAKEALPYLETLRDERTNYQQATTTAQTLAVDLEASSAIVARLRADVAVAKTAFDTSLQQRDEATRHSTIAQTQRQRATSDRDRFRSNTSAQVCSVCLQPIDAEHAAKELRSLEQAVQDAETLLARRQQEATDTAAVHDAADSEHRRLINELHTAETHHQDRQREATDAQKQQTTASDAFAKARARLASALADRVADIRVAGFPTDADVADLSCLAGALKVREQRRHELSKQQQDRDATHQNIHLLEQSVAAIGAPADVTVARLELTRLDGELQQLGTQRREAEAAKRAAQQEAQAASKDLATIAVAQQSRFATIARLGAEITAREEQMTRETEALPDAYRMRATIMPAAERATLQQRLHQLTSDQVEEQAAALADDRLQQANRQARLEETTQKLATVPTEARRRVVDVEHDVTTAHATTAKATQIRDAARRRRETLARQHADRDNAAAQLADAEYRHGLHDRLCDLLGKEGLELDLVRSAEGRITERANDILIQLSDGELRFEPPTNKDERTFNLAVRVRGSAAPTAVVNLSGGERFRTAIALALAISQGGDAKRPLETIIIDEGFGCLDQKGRTAMIAALRDGQHRTQMFKRIIVVSHQEDFADAFPVGYKLNAFNGQTEVQSFGV